MSSSSSRGVLSSTDSDGFARPPPDFNPETAGAAFLEGHGQGLQNPADAIEESVEDEIARKIAEVEKAKNGPLTNGEKERIANKIRSLREGGWLESLKLQLVGKNSVPIEYFNRLAAEHENTIARVAQINARADRRVAERDAEIEALLNLSENENNSGRDSSMLLNNQILTGDNQILRDENALFSDEIKNLKVENKKLKDNLERCQQRGTEMQNETQRLQTELQQQKNADGQDELAKCNDRVNELQSELDSTKTALTTSRGTASKYYDEIQAFRQQRIDLMQREQGNKDEIRRLREDVKNLTRILAESKKELAACAAKLLDQEFKLARAGSNNSDGLRQRISELEAERKKYPAEVDRLRQVNSKLRTEQSKCNDRVASLVKENDGLRNAAALQGEPNDPDDLRRRILELQAELARRDEVIRNLEAELAQARAAPQPGQDGAPPQEPMNELQARLLELRNARDMYRNRWARLMAAGGAAGPGAATPQQLTEFWQAVESTDTEIKELYRGIDRLGRVLGLTNILDTPQVLDRIITAVEAAVTNEQETLQLVVLNLRNVNLLARVQIETLERQLDRAQLGRSEDEVRAQLGVVQEDEVERRVSIRTQTYRDHRRRIIAHIFDAQNEFLALAETSGDRDAIEALVDRFLQPTSLPMIQLAQGARQ
ncbi:hypothetical protein F4803DRAFT_568796 [Xylaria telfairii]|nr:hypothetical protein F4803DRAFT_568796 [Xylaria telfairii]